MKKLFTAMAFFTLLFVLASCSNDNSGGRCFNGQSIAAFSNAIDEAMNSTTNKRGISVAVHKGGYQMWTYAAGFADGAFGSDTGTYMSIHTPTYAYSITKTTVSALVLTQIIDEGKYGLDDTVQDLLEGNEDYDNLSVGQKARINTTATVEELLTHTSGMLDYASNVNALIPLCNPSAEWSPGTILEDIVFEDLESTGIFRYSNTNYTLLGMIAQEEGGANLNQLLASKFFGPLDIDAVLPPRDSYPSDIAHPYDDAAIFGLGFPAGSFMDFSTAIKLLNSSYDIYVGIGRGTWAAGGIVATAGELAQWGYELYDDDGAAISDEVREVLKDSAPLDGNYGYGIRYDDFTYTDGTVGGTYGHGGSAPGYRTSLLYEESKGLCIAIITNVNNNNDFTGLLDQEALGHAILNGYSE